MSCSGWLFILTRWLSKMWHGWLSTCVLLRSKPFVVITFSSHPIWLMWWVHGQAHEGSWIRSNRSGCLRTFSLFLHRLALPLGCDTLFEDIFLVFAPPCIIFFLFIVFFFISGFIFIFHIILKSWLLFLLFSSIVFLFSYF